MTLNFKSISHLFVFIKQMGIKYIIFRIIYTIKKKTGYFQFKFPEKINECNYCSISEWRINSKPFFFQSKENLILPKNPQKELFIKANKILFDGIYPFFSFHEYKIGPKINWFYNVHSGYTYNQKIHWSRINELSSKEGDIKFVWELSRFSFIYTIIRYDYHFDKDSSKFIFSKIIDWIDENKYNHGPNFICSQEISLRVLNWIFALYFYKNSESLSEQIFQKIMHSIRAQIIHVYQNINFSRIAVRNNHAITETLAIYLTGLLFPFFPESQKWLKNGKRWFEKEIIYQIYDDGTYLQFSMNYHRVIIQLLSWAIKLSEINNEKLKPLVKEKAIKSIDFLYNCMNIKTGELPNYGANDGSLFFNLNNDDYKNYKNQLYALAGILKIDNKYYWNINNPEDIYWYGASPGNINSYDFEKLKSSNFIEFSLGGYYLIKDKLSMTFIKCGKYKDRPSHVDNLHTDIWYSDINYFRDNGSFLYNTDYEEIKYFMGTLSHNTVMIENYDQMLKFRNFIWLYWTQALESKIYETNDSYIFEGKIKAFSYLKSKITHFRKIEKFKNKPIWKIQDEIENADNFEKTLIWHPNPSKIDKISCIVSDQFGNSIDKKDMQGWYSPYYGYKEPSTIWLYKSKAKSFNTIIELSE
jgi:hypothetical protein